MNQRTKTKIPHNSIIRDMSKQISNLIEKHGFPVAMVIMLMAFNWVQVDALRETVQENTYVIEELRREIREN